MTLDPDAVRAYAERDWERLADRERAHWAAVFRRDGSRAVVEAVERLREHMRRVRPDWPTPEERRRDLEHHLELERRIDEAGRALGRRSSS